MCDDDDDNEACLGSIGFMFDAQHVRFTKKICIGDLIPLQLKMIGEDPGTHEYISILDKNVAISDKVAQYLS